MSFGSFQISIRNSNQLEKKLPFMTRIPQSPSLKFRSSDLVLKIQKIVSRPLQSFWSQQYCKDSSEKGCSSVYCVLVSSRDEYCCGICLVLPVTPLSLGVTGGAVAQLPLLFKQHLRPLFLQSSSCSCGFPVEFFIGECSTF